MDIGMPELDGFGATRKIREEISLLSVPIIAVTAFPLHCLFIILDAWAIAHLIPLSERCKESKLLI
jgi:hypothetical protein